LPTLGSTATTYGQALNQPIFVVASLTVTGGTTFIGGSLRLLSDQPGGSIAAAAPVGGWVALVRP